MVCRLQSWRMDTTGIVPNQVEARGVLDPEVLPYYPYRDDACALYASLRRYVSAVVEAVYNSEEKLRGDWELQQWRRELTTPREQGGVGLFGVPGHHDRGRCGTAGFYCCSNAFDYFTAAEFICYVRKIFL